MSSHRRRADINRTRVIWLFLGLALGLLLAKVM